MDARDYQQALEWFDRLVDHAPAARCEALKELRRQYPEVCRQVAVMLAHHDQAEQDCPMGESAQPVTRGVTTGPHLSPTDKPPGALSGEDMPSAIGKYAVRRRLASGGQGHVFLAWHPQFEQEVAVKWAHLDGTPEWRQRLIGEGQILYRLKVDGVVRVHDAGEHLGRPYLVFDYVHGRSLADRLRQSRERLPFRETAALVADLAGTLARLHRLGVQHRDVKPANILLGEDGRPILIDFGLAWQARRWEEIGSPEDVVCGTPAYMAPEQTKGEAGEIGEHTELFNLGAVLYELLTGRPPHAGSPADKVTREVWGRIERAEVTPPRQLDPRIPKRLESICLKALKAEPRERYGSAAEMEKDLRRYLRRRVVLAAGAGLAALVLAIVLTVGKLTTPITLPVIPLQGDLEVHVWSEARGVDAGMKIDREAALPVRNGEKLHLHAQLNQEAYVYLLWLDSEGKVWPLYPWNDFDHGRIVQEQLTAPPSRPARSVVHSPRDKSDGTPRGWEVAGESGLDTMLLLVRREPLADGVELASLIGPLPATSFRFPREFAELRLDAEQAVVAMARQRDRGPKDQAVEIDSPLLRLMSRLQPHFDMIRAVRFAHQQ